MIFIYMEYVKFYMVILSIDIIIQVSYRPDMPEDQFKHITLQQLEALVALVEERSFSNAAKKMMLSQPSLSKHVRNLETFVNANLIKRTKSGISLTSEGSILFAYGKKILKLRDEAREKVISLKSTASGHVSVGTSTIPSTYILPSVLTGLREEYPDIKVHILSGDSEDVLEMVLGNQVEIGFIGKQTQDSRLTCEPIWEDELILVAPKDHLLGKYEAAKVDEIINEPFVLRERGSGTRSIMEDYLKANNLPPLSTFNLACELGSSEAIKEAVISGLGISILSIHAVKRELKEGLLVRIPLHGPRILRNFFIIARKHFTPLPHHRKFIEFAKAFKIQTQV